MDEPLLPSNRKDLENDLDLEAARLGRVPVPVDTLWNPDTAPAAFLPWLAWALSVDTWDDTWPEAQKRAVIRNSYRVHAYKGTRAALDAALSALEIDVNVREWYEQSPEGAPYTFSAEVILTDKGLGVETQDQIVSIINANKNVRSHLIALNLVGSLSGSMTFGAFTAGADVAEIRPFAITEQEVAGAQFWAVGTTAFDVSSVYPQETP